MLDGLQIMDILEEVSYKDWRFVVRASGTDTQLRVEFDDPFEGEQHGRWWVISQHATKSEVVTTALKAALTAEEHEARENFRYKGVRIFGPHISVEALASIARFKGNLDLREEPVTLADRAGLP